MTSASNSTRRRPSPASGTIEINRQMGILFCQSERGDGMFRRSNGRAYNINTCIFEDTARKPCRGVPTHDLNSHAEIDAASDAHRFQ